MSAQWISPEDRVGVLELLPPFPIVLVSTQDNIITVNQVHYPTFRPLRLAVAIAHSRYTYGLLRKEGEFVVNVPDAALIEAIKWCGSISGRDTAKFAAGDLTPLAMESVAAVGVAECPAQIACRVSREVAFEARTWFIGDVVAVRKRAGFDGQRALLCGRHDYRLPGELISPR
jgi:flavin reductase (DIM6/NTAB) family NADH-FMN oxidoreductase RutF